MVDSGYFSLKGLKRANFGLLEPIFCGYLVGFGLSMKKVLQKAQKGLTFVKNDDTIKG